MGVDKLWILQWIVDKLWTTLWGKKCGRSCRFCLHISVGVGHICVHKLRGTSKPRASRRRSRRGCCGLHQSVPRLIHQNEDEKLKRGRANAQPPSGQRDDGSAWFKRHRQTRQLSPQRRSLGDGRHLGLCFPVSVSRRMSAGHPSTCPTSVGHVWPADSSETVHRTVARFALPSEHEHQLATWGVRFIPNGGKSTGTSGRSGGGESAKSTCTAQCAETAVTPRSGWAG